MKTMRMMSYLILVVVLLSGCHNNRELVHNFQYQHKVLLSSNLKAATQTAESAPAVASEVNNEKAEQATVATTESTEDETSASDVLAAMQKTEAATVTTTKPKAEKSSGRVSSNTNHTKAALMAQYQEWKNVRYRLGGTTKNGVDCSGFAQNTFASKFDVELPRDTSEQAKAGRSISKNQLQAGDLVFFNIGHGTRHVGIYLDGNQFLHASTSSGVIISELDNDYWTKHYWKAVRVAGI